LATKTIKLFNLLGEVETFVEFIRELRTYYESYNSCRWKMEKIMANVKNIREDK